MWKYWNLAAEGGRGKIENYDKLSILALCYIEWSWILYQGEIIGKLFEIINNL